MSEPGYATGTKRPAICICGTKTEEYELHGLYGSAWWHTEKHNGPCDLPCMNAGVHHSIYKTGNYHTVDGPCNHCRKL